MVWIWVFHSELIGSLLELMSSSDLNLVIKNRNKSREVVLRVGDSEPCSFAGLLSSDDELSLDRITPDSSHSGGDFQRSFVWFNLIFLASPFLRILPCQANELLLRSSHSELIFIYNWPRNTERLVLQSISWPSNIVKFSVHLNVTEVLWGVLGS